MVVREEPQKVNIPCKEYEEYAWITVQQFTDEEFRGLIKAMEELRFQVEVDYEDHSFCFTFKDFIPRRPQDIRICKTRNTQICKRFLNDLYKVLPGRFYFNVGKRTLKKLW
jgi:hypothetical protein